jgi:hypothetical protein
LKASLVPEEGQQRCGFLGRRGQNHHMTIGVRNWRVCVLLVRQAVESPKCQFHEELLAVGRDWLARHTFPSGHSVLSLAAQELLIHSISPKDFERSQIPII